MTLSTWYFCDAVRFETNGALFNSASVPIRHAYATKLDGHTVYGGGIMAGC
jgi:hypothetical protein